MSEAIMDLQEQKNRDIASTEPDTVQSLRKKYEDASYSTDCARARYDLAATENRSEEETQAEKDLWAQMRACQQDEANALLAWANARDNARLATKNEKDPNDKDENDQVPADPQGQAEEDSYKS